MKLPFPLIVAGPCSAETEEQVCLTAKKVALNPSVRFFRAGLWKPRTRPGPFDGVGERGLPWLAKAKALSGLLITTEVANAHHVEKALDFQLDALWLGARTTVNPFSVQEIANALKGTKVPVMVKNPLGPDLSLWEGALERLERSGPRPLVAVHRGFCTFEKTKYRNAPLWKLPLELKRRHPDLPLICDPSHIAGKRDMIPAVAQMAIDMGMEGLMVEVHPGPETALSDRDQQLTPESFHTMLASLCYRKTRCKDAAFETALEEFRRQIDRCDQEIIEALRRRFEIVECIGRAKRENNVTAFQIHRMDALMKGRMELAEKAGLGKELIKELYQAIHEESVKRQVKLMKSR